VNAGENIQISFLFDVANHELVTQSMELEAIFNFDAVSTGLRRYRATLICPVSKMCGLKGSRLPKKFQK
jgi:hypothetical protein